MNKTALFKTKKSFTLIELLIVILLMGIIMGATISVINPNVIRGRARDSQRKSDLGKVQAALEMYFASNRKYPVASNFTAVSSINLSAVLSATPKDPLEGTASKSCYGKSAYNYYLISNDGKYVLGTILENEISTGQGLCSEASNCTNGSFNCNCSGTDKNYCYAVQNPL